MHIPAIRSASNPYDNHRCIYEPLLLYESFKQNACSKYKCNKCSEELLVFSEVTVKTDGWKENVISVERGRFACMSMNDRCHF